MDSAIGYSLAVEAAHGNVAKLEVRKPRESALALEMLANGERYADVVAATGLSYANVAALRTRHGEAIAIRREKAADDAEHMADLYREALERRAEQVLGSEEALARVNPKDLALAYGIMRDKASGLRGDATAVVEHRREISLEQAKEMIEAARKRVREEAVNV